MHAVERCTPCDQTGASGGIWRVGRGWIGSSRGIWIVLGLDYLTHTRTFEHLPCSEKGRRGGEGVAATRRGICEETRRDPARGKMARVATVKRSRIQAATPRRVQQ